MPHTALSSLIRVVGLKQCVLNQCVLYVDNSLSATTASNGVLRVHYQNRLHTAHCYSRRCGKSISI
eukprot:11430-Heterococcus_DN1.PRE.3